jgi:hypothetical protein
MVSRLPSDGAYSGRGDDRPVHPHSRKIIVSKSDRRFFIVSLPMTYDQFTQLYHILWINFIYNIQKSQNCTKNLSITLFLFCEITNKIEMYTGWWLNISLQYQITRRKLYEKTDRIADGFVPGYGHGCLWRREAPG